MFEKGSVVKSAAGHDQGRFFAVLRLEGEYAYIADGKRRKLAAPKKKKLKHLRRTSTVLEIDSVQTDNQLKKLLSTFNDELSE